MATDGSDDTDNALSSQPINNEQQGTSNSVNVNINPKSTPRKKNTNKKKVQGTWVGSIGEDPEFISELVASGNTVPGVIVDAYAEYVKYLYEKGSTKTAREK